MKKRTRNQKKQILYCATLICLLLVIAIIMAIEQREIQKEQSDFVAHIPSPTVTIATTNTRVIANPTSQPRNKATANAYKIKRKVIYKREKLLSKHSITNWNSSTDRNTNLAVAARIINKKKGNKYNLYVLDVQEEFSWLKVVGKTTKKKGFKKAGILVNGKHAEALGGGICQLATTCNSAAIKAGLLTIAVKHYKVSPAYLGENDFEATVTYDGGKDLKIINNKKYPIGFKAIGKGPTTTVKFFKMKKIIKYVEY